MFRQRNRRRRRDRNTCTRGQTADQIYHRNPPASGIKRAAQQRRVAPGIKTGARRWKCQGLLVPDFSA